MIRRQTFKMTTLAAAVVLVSVTWALVRAQDGPNSKRSPGAAPAPPGMVRSAPNVPGAVPPAIGRDGWVNYAVPGAAPFEHDPEMAKLAETEMELAHQADAMVAEFTSLDLAAADDPAAEQKKFKSRLREALAKQFDVQRQRRELELKRIEERVQKLRDQIKKRNDARETIIDRRLDQLTTEAEGLGWGQPAGNATVRPPSNYFRDSGVIRDKK